MANNNKSSDRDNKGRFTSSGAKKYGKLGGEASRDARKKKKSKTDKGQGMDNSDF